jgi:hypothetical protein
LRLCEDGASRPSARARSTAWLRRRFPAETAEHRTAGTRDLARRHATRLTTWQHAPAVVADWPPMDPSCTWPGSQPDDLRRSGQASVLSCLRGTRQVRGRYIAGGDASRATTRTKSRRTAPARQRYPRPAAQGRVTPPTNARANRARSPTRKVSRSPGPLPQSSAHRLPGRPRSGKTPEPPGRHTGMHARLDGACRARTHSWHGPSVAVREKSTVTLTARRTRTPSAIRPWTPPHDGPQRYKVTHTGTEKKRPASTRIRS